jgi:hypothetical protein
VVVAAVALLLLLLVPTLLLLFAVKTLKKETAPLLPSSFWEGRPANFLCPYNGNSGSYLAPQSIASSSRGDRRREDRTALRLSFFGGNNTGHGPLRTRGPN